jgi:hypothetical protein
MDKNTTYRVFRRLGAVSAAYWNVLASKGYNLKEVHPGEYLPKDDEHYTRVPMKATEEWRDIVIVTGSICTTKKQISLYLKGYALRNGDFYVSIDNLMLGIMLEHIDKEHYEAFLENIEEYNVDGYPIA